MDRKDAIQDMVTRNLRGGDLDNVELNDVQLAAELLKRSGRDPLEAGADDARVLDLADEVARRRQLRVQARERVRALAPRRPDGDRIA